MVVKCGVYVSQLHSITKPENSWLITHVAYLDIDRLIPEK